MGAPVGVCVGGGGDGELGVGVWGQAAAFNQLGQLVPQARPSIPQPATQLCNTAYTSSVERWQGTVTAML